MILDRFRFWILTLLVTISGMSQGMLMPLLAIILEQAGISSSINGLHATGLYIGVLLASPFMEKPMHKYGFKPIIVIGGLVVIVSLAIFPIWESLWFWFILRVTIGIGDNMLHFGTQTWITTTADKNSRGRSISIYGMSFGLGFAIGPLLTRLIEFHESLPFIVSAALSTLVWLLMLFVRNKWPKNTVDTISTTKDSSMRRFIQTTKIAWIALLPPLAYGFLEATLHATFPIYGLRIGHNVDVLSLIIPCFAAGSLVSQLPLGILSDKYGRRHILLVIISLGLCCFFAAALLETSSVSLFILFSLAGVFVGSLYSLGISYMTDLLPTALLPAGNLLCSIAFSVGSLGGPYLGGLFIELFPGVSFFYVIAFVLAIIVALMLFKGDKNAEMLPL
ncbi:MFS transporter [Ornithinibacillus bavariensis]|uniref:MFS-type transporter YfkF n=1 Tax=Ornithinibacillus bavariensis TaxID=545502 RepID=A0A919X8P2_9BACI|nr:MFS transporter [Ornithinibacillus bavariensis]GIO27874.1 putative MFS-type transporter YfkF [Ornithinibacillus bavariensis]HAM80349.1 MFS transporter [Ornithinibacillus sp.]